MGQDQSKNSRLSAYPLELAYNITFNRIKYLGGFGLYFLKSRIEGQHLISKSNYLDFGYFLSCGYGFDIELIKLTAEMKINYIIDTEIISINPMLSISYSF